MTTESATGANQSGYVFDNALQEARQRLALLEALWDPGTIRHLRSVGVSDGWKCLEVGAGGGSITQWLCHEVGVAGRVLATDINTRFLQTLAEPNLEVRQHNIVSDDLEQEAYDLVCARLVLVHIPEREQALERMVAALKPGGWLFVEDFDRTTASIVNPEHDPDTAAFYDEIRVRLLGPGEQFRMASNFGRRLYGLLRACDLTSVASEGHLLVACGGSPYGVWQQANIELTRNAALSAGFTTDEEMDRLVSIYGDPNFIFTAPMMIAAWGQKPTG